MELKWLEDFLSLAETHSFSRSAAERYVTQPAFSRRIKALESWLGVELVDRSAFPTALTPAGRLFREAAADVVRQLYDTRAMLRGQERLPENGVAFAVAHTLSLTYFPRWFRELQDRSGAVVARVVATNVHDGVLALVNGACDMLLCYYHPRLPLLLDANRYTFQRLALERMVPVSACDAGGGPRLPGTAAEPLPFLSYTPNSFFGRSVELILEQAPVPLHLRTCYEADMAEAVKVMALEGHGLAWLPQSAVARELEQGRLVRAGGDEWSTEFEVRIYCASDNRKTIVKRLWTFLGERIDT